MGVNQVHPTRRRSKIIERKHDIIQQEILNSTVEIQDISHIPEPSKVLLTVMFTKIAHNN